jgi:hypothetical protein
MAEIWNLELLVSLLFYTDQTTRFEHGIFLN